MSLGKHPRLKSSRCAFAPHQENRSVSSQFEHKLLSKRLQNNLGLLFFVYPFLNPECGLITLIFWFRFRSQSKFSLFVFLCEEVRVGCILQCLWFYCGSLADLELFFFVVGFVLATFCQINQSWSLLERLRRCIVWFYLVFYCHSHFKQAGQSFLTAGRSPGRGLVWFGWLLACGASVGEGCSILLILGGLILLELGIKWCHFGWERTLEWS